MASITLRSVPKDVIQFILNMQKDLKTKKKVGQYSQELTVIQIIKEYKKSKER